MYIPIIYYMCNYTWHMLLYVIKYCMYTVQCIVPVHPVLECDVITCHGCVPSHSLPSLLSPYSHRGTSKIQSPVVGELTRGGEGRGTAFLLACVTCRTTDTCCTVVYITSCTSPEFGNFLTAPEFWNFLTAPELCNSITTRHWHSVQWNLRIIFSAVFKVFCENLIELENKCGDDFPIFLFNLPSISIAYGEQYFFSTISSFQRYFPF